MPKGRIKIKDQAKVLTRYLATERVTKPEVIYLPIETDRSKSVEVFVNPGDKVKVGQVVGKRDCGFYEQNIHSTVSGEVLPNAKKFYRSGKMVNCIAIKNDMQDTYNEGMQKQRSLEEIYSMSQQEVSDIVKELSLVGLGGSGFPTYIKFNTQDNIDRILINGIECEPFLSSDYKLIIDQTKRVALGVSFAMSAFNAKEAVIAVKYGRPELVQVLNEAIEEYTPDFNIKVKEVGNHYPLGWEIETIRATFGVKVPHGVLPSKHGIMTLNVSTSVGLYRALKYNSPVINRTFTVTGDGVKKDKSFRVRIGSPIKPLIFDNCAGYTSERINIVFGGPMMGAPMVSDDLIVSPTSTSIIVLKERIYDTKACLRCGACAASCPKDLMPALLMQHAKTRNSEAVTKLNASHCIQCGICSYVCTSKIQVTEFVGRAKKLVK